MTTRGGNVKYIGPIIAAAFGACAAWSAPAAAQTADYGVAADCPALIAQTEAARNIPRGLLMAVALTESGNGGRPSPYAMNIAGRSHFASTGQEMAGIIASNWQRGVTSIDVGCMQVNLKFHGMKFARLTDLLDSRANVAYGASYLISLAVESGSWKDAVMSYHNKRNPSRRAWYGCKVWNNYLRINGQTSGYLQCGGAPSGSSTASTATMISAPARNNWAAGRQAGPLTPPSSAPGTVMIGGRSVDVPIPARRPVGTIALSRQDQQLPDVVNDDARQSAFTAVRPNDWSGRVQRAKEADARTATATASSGTATFGWVRRND